MPWQRPPNTNIQSHASKNAPTAKFTAGTCGTLKPRLRQLSQANHTLKSASVPPKKAKPMMSVQIPNRIKSPKSPPWKAQCLHNPENSLKTSQRLENQKQAISAYTFKKKKRERERETRTLFHDVYFDKVSKTSKKSSTSAYHHQSRKEGDTFCFIYSLSYIILSHFLCRRSKLLPL